MQVAHKSDLVVEIVKKSQLLTLGRFALRGPLIHHLSHGRTGRDGINEGAVTEGIGNVSCGLVPIDTCHRSLSGFDDVGVGTLVHNGLVLCLEWVNNSMICRHEAQARLNVTCGAPKSENLN